MTRRLATFAAGVSLVLCVATMVLWVRSYFAGDVVQHTRFSERRMRCISLLSSRGLLSVGCERHEYANSSRGARSMQLDREHTGVGLQYRAEDADDWWAPKIGRFHAEHVAWSEDSNTFSGAYLVFPHWLPAVLSATLPALWLVARLRRRHLPAHGCLACGYDLRATPARCPECGAVPAAPAAR